MQSISNDTPDGDMYLHLLGHALACQCIGKRTKAAPHIATSRVYYNQIQIACRQKEACSHMHRRTRLPFCLIFFSQVHGTGRPSHQHYASACVLYAICTGKPTGLMSTPPGAEDCYMSRWLTEQVAVSHTMVLMGFGDATRHMIAHSCNGCRPCSDFVTSRGKCTTELYNLCSDTQAW